MPENLLPRTIAGFTEYLKIAYAKALNSLNVYGVSPDKLTSLMPLYNAYVQAEAIAANPETVTTGACRTRDEARKVLEPAWRKFINECIRYNSAVPAADLEVFRIKECDTTRTRAGIPDKIAIVSVKTVGARRPEVDVLDSETGKKKKPQYAAGSYIYVAVTESGQTQQHESEYRKLDFSSRCRHTVEFPLEQARKTGQHLCPLFQRPRPGMPQMSGRNGDYQLRHQNVNLMKTFIRTVILTFALLTAMSGCSERQEDIKPGDTPLRFYKSELEFLGATVPFLIREEPSGNGYTHIVGLIPHARRFYLNEGITVMLSPERKDAGTRGSTFLQLLKTSEENHIPVRIYVCPETDDIMWVEEASEEEIKKYEQYYAHLEQFGKSPNFIISNPEIFSCTADLPMRLP
jgi:hypothetical protein